MLTVDPTIQGAVALVIRCNLLSEQLIPCGIGHRTLGSLEGGPSSRALEVGGDITCEIFI
jgi:hypothetical protein